MPNKSGKEIVSQLFLFFPLAFPYCGGKLFSRLPRPRLKHPQQKQPFLFPFFWEIENPEEEEEKFGKWELAPELEEGRFFGEGGETHCRRKEGSFLSFFVGQ